MGFFKKAKESKDDAEFLIEDGRRRMKIQTNWMKSLKGIQPQIDLFFDTQDNGALKEYYKGKTITDVYTFELLYYPFSEENSKALGDNYLELYLKALESRERFKIFEMINGSYFYLRDKYGLKALDEPKKADLSSCLSMYIYEKYYKTIPLSLIKPEIIKTLNLEDNPIPQASDWGTKNLFDGKFYPDFNDVKDYVIKNVHSNTGGDYAKVMKNMQSLFEKKNKEYNKQLSHMGISLENGEQNE